ncbi:MAG: dTDP-4-dehydrorhamnose reductase [Lentisphaerae bacterium GWF2_45_14]|nr:MAG: dTDP-4-dehydrorhamnose reductase [Lentisphaerae bacterium GWF2_45_14]
MLGLDLNAAVNAKGFEPIIYDLPDFDISNKEMLEDAVASSDMIVNCAAYTNVDKAESEREIAEKVNAVAPGMLGVLARKYGRYVVHISTDFVFGDTKEDPLSETDTPHPLSIYGSTKLEGERLLIASGCGYSIIRIQWTYGTYGNNFITKIVSLAQKNKSLKIVNDQTGSPTHTADVANAIICFLEKTPAGLFHFAASGYTTRYETALFAFKSLGIDIEVLPCSSSDFKTPARRPLNSKFDCSKIDGILDFKRPFWQDSLKEFLDATKLG